MHTTLLQKEEENKRSRYSYQNLVPAIQTTAKTASGVHALITMPSTR
jgi:hypothetical protein